MVRGWRCKLPVCRFRGYGRRRWTQGENAGCGAIGEHRRSTGAAGRRPCADCGARRLPLAGCFGETFQRGYVLPEGALEQIPARRHAGAGADRARHALHRRHRSRRGVLLHLANAPSAPVSFMPTKSSTNAWSRSISTRTAGPALANYGLKDGKIFDFVSRTTPTAGYEQSFLKHSSNDPESHFALPF